MAISTNPKPTIYRNLYENTGPEYWSKRTTLEVLTQCDRKPDLIDCYGHCQNKRRVRDVMLKQGEHAVWLTSERYSSYLIVWRTWFNSAASVWKLDICIYCRHIYIDTGTGPRTRVSYGSCTYHDVPCHVLSRPDQVLPESVTSIMRCSHDYIKKIGHTFVVHSSSLHSAVVRSSSGLHKNGINTCTWGLSKPILFQPYQHNMVDAKRLSVVNNLPHLDLDDAAKNDFALAHFVFLGYT